MGTHEGYLRLLEETDGLSVVSPLSYETGIERNFHGLLLTAYAEGGLSIALTAGSEEIETGVGAVGRKRQGVALTGQSVEGLSLTESEGNAIDRKSVVGEEFGGIAVASLEIGLAAEAVKGGTLEVVRK